MDKYRIHFPDSALKEQDGHSYFDVYAAGITGLEYETYLGRELYKVEYLCGRHNNTLYLDEGSYITAPDGKTYRYDDFPRLAMKLENEKLKQVLDGL